MDVHQQLAMLQRQFRNLIRHGVVVSVDGAQVVVKLDMEDSTPGLLTPKLPMIGRSSAEVGEPVIVLLPEADPADGWVFCLQHDPQIDVLTNRLEAVERRCQTLSQQVINLGQVNE